MNWGAKSTDLRLKITQNHLNYSSYCQKTRLWGMSVIGQPRPSPNSRCTIRSIRSLGRYMNNLARMSKDNLRVFIVSDGFFIVGMCQSQTCIFYHCCLLSIQKTHLILYWFEETLKNLHKLEIWTALLLIERDLLVFWLKSQTKWLTCQAYREQ